MTELFRKEAIKHAARRIDGEVVVARSVSVGALSWLSVAFIASGAIFLATSSYARKETVPGWLTTSAGVVRVTARGDGVVDQLLVQEGQTVVQGQPLHFLRNDRQAFQATRDKLAALPEPPQFARARAAFSEKYGQPGPVWPLNLDVVDSLAACFGLPYRQAYSCTKDAQP